VGVLSYTPDSDLSDVKYYWRVRAYNNASPTAQAGPWSAVRNLTIDTLAPAMPVLKTPFDKSVSTVTPSYGWAAPVSAMAYEFRYDTHADCDSPDYTSPLLSTISHKPVSQPYGVFYWCVRARDAAGNWSSWSVPYKLIITPF
jgi:hypothetical protein